MHAAPEDRGRGVTAEDVERARAFALEGAQGQAPALEEATAYVGPSGAKHVTFHQRVDGLEVYGEDIKVATDRAGTPIVAKGHLQHAGGEHATVPIQRALKIAAAAGGVKHQVGAVSSQASTPEQRTLFKPNGFVASPSARLVLVPAPDESRVAWLVTLPESVANWPRVLVDARSGQVLSLVNLASSAGPEGEAFFYDPDDGPPQDVGFSGALTAPRDQWSTGGLTEGNNVVAGEDRDSDFEPAPVPIQPYGFTDSFRASDGVDSETDLGAAVSNVFYWLNVAHDRFYERGFTEAAGNMQEDNFGAGGAGGDPVIALVQYGADFCDGFFPPCINDARFITQDEGLPAFASFTLFRPPYRHVDSAFASDVILHEYVHGVSNRLIGVGLVGGVHSFALGEGWSDFFAASITGDPVIGEYLNGDTVRGIRSHSMAESPLTYADLCHINPAGCDAHVDGGIWSATLWDIRTALIARYGDQEGIRRAEELIVEGMMFTPGHPSFTDARDGILEADLVRSGADHCALWSIFSARGMGASATGTNLPPSSSAAFDLPAYCDGVGPSTDPDGMPDSFEAVNSCLNATADDADDDPDRDTLPNIREWVLGTEPCNSDTDGDHCEDGLELGMEPVRGGGRDPLDYWDFFEVTGNRIIDLSDMLDVLAYFGSPSNGSAAVRDRYSPDPARPWKTAYAANGVDLRDALVALKSFGHSCLG